MHHHQGCFDGLPTPVDSWPQLPFLYHGVLPAGVLMGELFDESKDDWYKGHGLGIDMEASFKEGHKHKGDGNIFYHMNNYNAVFKPDNDDADGHMETETSALMTKHTMNTVLGSEEEGYFLCFCFFKNELKQE